MKSLLVSAAFVLAMALPAQAQTANGNPTTAAPPALPGTPHAVTRTAPSAGRGAKPPSLGADTGLPKPTKADLAEQRKLEHDMRICIGC